MNGRVSIREAKSKKESKERVLNTEDYIPPHGCWQGLTTFSKFAHFFLAILWVSTSTAVVPNDFETQLVSF